MSDGGHTVGDPVVSVLICDDNESIRVLLDVIVTRSPGMRVVGEAADGLDVIVQAKALLPDVILLDLAMPHLSGLEALPELRRVTPETRIIVLSGFADANVADRVLELGAASYLKKGAHPDTIIATILEVMAARQQPISTRS